MRDKPVAEKMAIQLKALGFNEPTQAFYAGSEMRDSPYWFIDDKLYVYRLEPRHEKTAWAQCLDELKEDEATVIAPTMSVVQKWLREVHNIYVEPHVIPREKPCYNYKAFAFHGDTDGIYWVELTNLSLNDFDSYEDALEQGLYVAFAYMEKPKTKKNG